MRFEAELLAVEPTEDRLVEAGGDGTITMKLLGRVDLPEHVGGSLDVWWLHQYGGGIFIPLRDGTSGDGSYGGGRYLLDTAKGSWLGGDTDSLTLDLNYAYHPSCRYNPRWQCPLAPPGNTITSRVEAGDSSDRDVSTSAQAQDCPGSRRCRTGIAIPARRRRRDGRTSTRAS